MSDFTPRANLRLPGGGSTGLILPDEQVDIDVLNDNFRKIDALLGVRVVPSASSYSGTMDGDLVYARDTKQLHVFSSDSGSLVSPRLPGSNLFKGTRAQRDAASYVEAGDHWQVTGNPADTGEYYWDGSRWTQRKSGFVPMAPTSVVPTGGTATVTALGEITFSSCSSVLLNEVFTSDFRHYRMYVDLTGASATGALWMRVASGTTPSSSPQYNYMGVYYDAVGTTGLACSQSNDRLLVGDFFSGSARFGSIIEIMNPTIAGSNTSLQWRTTGIRSDGGARSHSLTGELSQVGARDGILITTNSGTTTSGVIKIYGIV